jgi:hypothetical protein
LWTEKARAVLSRASATSVESVRSTRTGFHAEIVSVTIMAVSRRASFMLDIEGIPCV